MKSDLELRGAPANISIDESSENLSAILSSLRSMRDNIPHHPEILHWIEKALLEAENQLLIIRAAYH